MCSRDVGQPPDGAVGDGVFDAFFFDAGAFGHVHRNSITRIRRKEHHAAAWWFAFLFITLSQKMSVNHDATALCSFMLNFREYRFRSKFGRGACMVEECAVELA